MGARISDRFSYRPAHSEQVLRIDAYQRRHENRQHDDGEIFYQRDADHDFTMRRLQFAAINQ